MNTANTRSHGRGSAGSPDLIEPKGPFFWTIQDIRRIINIDNRWVASLVLLLLLAIPGPSRAQDRMEGSPTTSWSIEVDPATFAFDGWSAHLRMKPASCDRLLVGAGVYAMDLPSMMVDLKADNRDQGWDVRLDLGAGIFAEHHFREVNRGFLLGAQVGVQRYQLGNDALPGAAEHTDLLVMGYGGYSIRPFSVPVYLKAWAGLGYTTLIAGDDQLGDLQYTVGPVAAFATFHIGYTLEGRP